MKRGSADLIELAATSARSGSEERTSGLGETTCRGAPVVASGRARARSRSASRNERGFGRARNAVACAGRLGVQCCAVVGAPRGDMGSSPRVLRTRPREAVATPSTRGRGDELPTVRWRWGSATRSRAGPGSVALPPTPEGRASGVAELRLRGARERPLGVLAANADAHGAASCRGRAPGCARGERGRSTGLRVRRSPTQASGKLRVARPQRGVVHGAEVAAAVLGPCAPPLGRPSGPPSEERTVRWSSRGRSNPRGFGPAGAVGGGRAVRGRRRVTRERWRHRERTHPFAFPFSTGSRGLNGRGLRLMSCRAPTSPPSRGLAPEAAEAAVRGAHVRPREPAQMVTSATSTAWTSFHRSHGIFRRQRLGVSLNASPRAREGGCGEAIRCNRPAARRPRRPEVGTSRSGREYSTDTVLELRVRPSAAQAKATRGSACSGDRAGAPSSRHALRRGLPRACSPTLEARAAFA